MDMFCSSTVANEINWFFDRDTNYRQRGIRWIFFVKSDNLKLIHYKIHDLDNYWIEHGQSSYWTAKS